jgi:hypothetical protein
MAYFISIMLTASVILSLIALGVALQPDAKAEIVRPSLVVEDVYFVMTPGTDSSSSSKDVTMSAFITNTGKEDAANVEVRTFAIDSDTNLGVDSNQVSLGLLPKETTGEAMLKLTVPEGNSYRIELLVFESGKIVVRGSGTVKLMGSSGHAGEDFTTDGGARGDPIEKKDEDGIFGSGDDKSSSSGVFALFALGFIIIVIITIAAVAGKNAVENSNRAEITTIKRFDSDSNGNGNGGNPRPAGGISMGSSPSPSPADKPPASPIIYKQEV